jgi:hypothetical protein
MICISSKGICGEDDFRYLWAEEARTHGVNEGDHAGQKGRYVPDRLRFGYMNNPWSDKFNGQGRGRQDKIRIELTFKY